MPYLFKGSLCGLICPECPENLSRVKVRLYRVRQTDNIAALAVANPKDTIAILPDEEIKAKSKFLLAEVETDDDGRFTFELGDQIRYAGEPFEVDVYCEKVPNQKLGNERPKPRQLSITTLQPVWRRTENGFTAVWNYCIPARVYCAFRALFGAWTICGRVLICDTKRGAANVRVIAYDADWLQQDELGSAITDVTGRFRINYSTADFQKTIFSPLLNVELFGGPDLYFRVEDSGGVALLEEPVTRGRQPDRENSGPCFCVELCVDATGPTEFDNPLFTHVGDFHILSNIDAATGLTAGPGLLHGGPGFGFFGAPELRGFCPKTSPIGAPDPMRYRFLYVHPSAPGTPVPITPDKVSPVTVGSRIVNWDFDGTGPVVTFQSIQIKGSGATNPDPTPSPLPPPGTPWGPLPPHVIVPDAQGWITVDPLALGNGFNGPLIRFNSTTAVPGGPAPGNGAGVPPSSPRSGVPLSVIFEAGPVGGATTFTNTLPKILFNNWDEVHQLNLLQFQAPGADACEEIVNDLDIQFTVDHELIATWSIGISSAASFPPPPALPSGPTPAKPRGDADTHHVNVSGWPSCSYTVSLHTRRKLTDGEQDDSGRTVPLTFCK